MTGTRQQLRCPFCGALVAETPVPYMGPYVALEDAAREHLRAEHPVRWRLSRKFRRAMRKSLQRRSVPGRQPGFTAAAERSWLQAEEERRNRPSGWMIP